VIDGRAVVPSEVRVRAGTEGRSILDLTLQEGRNRIVRRWAEAMGLKVDRLARLSYGPVRLGDLPPGRYRPLTPHEERALYRAVQLDPDAPETEDTGPASGKPKGRRPRRLPS
jgi:23S rRNA pseudouridine2605 synthase